MATVTTDSQPIVGAYGDIFTAPLGTPPPDDLEEPPAPWVKLGMVSEDGVAFTPPEEDTTDIGIWQSAYPARTVTTKLSSSMKFALDGWNRVTVPFAMGGGTFEDKPNVVIYHPPKPGESASRAVYVRVLDGDVRLGFGFQKGRVIGRDDTTWKKDEAALLNVEFGLEGSVDYDPFFFVFDPDTFPANGTIVATGATAGTPGTFTPAGATPPASLTALQGGSVVANPATAWTTGQYVNLGDTTKAYWDVDTWESGMAP